MRSDMENKGQPNERESPGYSAPGYGYHLDDPEKPIDFRYYLFLLTKNFYILLTFFVIIVASASIYVFKMPNIYESTAQIIMEKPQSPVGAQTDASGADDSN